MPTTSGSTTGTKIDLGTVVKDAAGSWDVLRRLSHEITDEKRMQYLTLHCKPSESDILHSHQVTKGKKTWKVSFQSKWLKQFPWLCYSYILEGGICSHCILFPNKVTKGTTPGVLVTVPYQKSYTKALGKDGILNCHEQSAMHRYATEQADLFKQTFQNPDRYRVDSQLATAEANQATENKEILRQIVLAVEFLAKQSLSFRGHRDDRVDFSSYETNRGNFVALLQLLAKGNEPLQKHLMSASRQARYTSKTIQNEVIHVYSSKIKERLTAELRDKGLPFTIIADEGTDPHSNQEILSLCLRFVDQSSPNDPHVKECLISFMHLQRTNSTMISRKILESLSDPSVSLDPSNIRGQAYDGASVMSSGKEGVQAKIKEFSPLALFTHCYAHCLNLSIAATCKLAEVRNLIGLINEAYLFLNNSPKRQQLFELTLKEYLPENSHSKLPGLCKTRWVERHTCLDVFLEMYEILLTFLDAIVAPHEYPNLKSSTGSWNWDKDTITKAQGLKASLSSFQTVVVFITTKNILDEVKALASKLQKRDQDIYEAYMMVDEVIGNIKSARKNIDSDFKVWYTEVLNLAEKLGIVEAVPRKTSIQRNRSNIPSSSPIDHYKKSVAIPLLDSLISQMEDRFSVEDRHARHLLYLVPSIIVQNTMELSEATKGMLFWENDLPFPKSLGNELRRWQTMWQSTEKDLPNNLLLALGACDEDAFPNIHRLLLIACTLPISSAEAERSFSLMKRIKTCTRSTMSEERFSDLAVIAMHYPERFEVDEICEAFVKAHPRRLFQASLFD